MTWGDGRQYYGQFFNGKEQGDGTFQFKDGNLYIGKFYDGKPHGVGVFIEVTEGWKRHGEWKEGKRIAWLSGPEEVNLSNSPIKRLSHMHQLHMT